MQPTHDRERFNVINGAKESWNAARKAEVRGPVSLRQFAQSLKISGDVVTMNKCDFDKFARAAAAQIEFDEKWYLSEYKDVAEALRRGQLSSARSHFIDDGFVEGRWAANPRVDEDWYLRAYPDVALAVIEGAFMSGYEHYTTVGISEGRLPVPPKK